MVLMFGGDCPSKTSEFFAGKARGGGVLSTAVGQLIGAWVNAMIWLKSWLVSFYSSAGVIGTLRFNWLLAPIALGSPSKGGV